MIHPMLHRQPVVLDRQLHRDLKVHQPQPDWSFTAGLNALVLAAVEFGDACREYPILFVRTGADEQGRAQVAPIAALGLAQGENLFLQDAQWRALYLPALLRSYPFGLGQAEGQPHPVLSIDIGWSGLSRTEGVPLFGADGEPSEHLRTLQRQLEQLNTEIQRTRELCRLLQDKALLRDMRFDADLPDGQKLHVDGFLAIDDAKLGQLPDADLLTLQRSGVMGLIHAHLISMGNLRKLAQWRVERGGGADPAPTTAPAPRPPAAAAQAPGAPS